MALVTSLPSSNTNKNFAYARAEFLSDEGRRRVLVWELSMATSGRTGSVSLRDGLGAQDLPGTRQALSRDELMAFCREVEATGVVRVAGHEIRFEEPERSEFVRRCRLRLLDAQGGE